MLSVNRNGVNMINMLTIEEEPSRASLAVFTLVSLSIVMAWQFSAVRQMSRLKYCIHRFSY